MSVLAEIVLVGLGGATAFLLGVRLIWPPEGSELLERSEEPVEERLVVPPVPEIPAMSASEPAPPEKLAQSTRTAEFLMH